MRILIVADEEACGATCGGFSIDEAARLEEATGHIENVPYDAVVLDLGLPDGDGLTLFRTIRGPRWPSSSDLTARDSLQNHVRGLYTGADDYLRQSFCDGTTGGSHPRATFVGPGRSWGGLDRWRS